MDRSTPALSPVTTSMSYRHAHWYFAVALAAIVGGFWPSFFKPLGAGSVPHTIHGITATLWVLALITQSVLMSRGLVHWHRRVAWVALVALLPVLIVTALKMVAMMMANPNMPPFLPPILAFIDLPSLLFLILLVTLALRNVRTPSAHKRFMSATILLGLPPALTRLYLRLFDPVENFMLTLHGSFVTVELVLVALMVSDWRAGERRLAYPMSFAFFSVIHALMVPIGTSAGWQGFMHWYAALPVFA